MAKAENSFGPRNAQQLLQLLGIERAVRQQRRCVLPVRPEPGPSGFQRTKSFLHRLLECAADGHGLPHAFHLRGQHRVSLRKLFKSETRNLDHAVVNGRLKARRSLARDVIAQFVQGVADGQLGRDLGDGESGRLGGQGRGARDPRVHLDHDHASALRTDGKLDVRAPGFHADGADNGKGCIAHGLILPVGQGLDRGHGDRISGMHPHRVEVLDRADDHAVVGPVPHDLDFEFLPAQQRLLDKDLADRREVEPAGQNRFELLAVVGDAATASAQGVGRTDDQGIAPDLGRDGVGLGQIVRYARVRHVETDLDHNLLENQTVLPAFDRVGLGPDQARAKPLQLAAAVQIHRGIERRLAPERREDRIRLLPFDNLGDDLRRDRLDVGPVGELGIGHDGGRVRVDEDDLVSLLPQRLAGLHPGVVEFAALADDNGARANNENFAQGSVFRHGCWARCLFSGTGFPVQCNAYPVQLSLARRRPEIDDAAWLSLKSTRPGFAPPTS